MAKLKLVNDRVIYHCLYTMYICLCNGITLRVPYPLVHCYTCLRNVIDLIGIGYLCSCDW